MKNYDLHSGTCFKKKEYNDFTEEWHKDPKSGDIVITEVTVVSDGECISKEFQITEVIPAGGLIGKLKRLIAEPLSF